MVKAQSVATVAEIADQFRNSSAAVITEYRGLTMKQITALRRALGSDTDYTVAKNTLVKRAAADAGVEGLDDLFAGPTAIAFVRGEPSDAAKAIREFAKTNPLLVIKGGVLDGRPLKAADVSKIADLESREVLLAKFAGAMKGNLSKAAAVFIQLPSQMARLAAALQDKRVQDGETAPDAAAADSAADTAAVDTAAAADTAAVTLLLLLTPLRLTPRLSTLQPTTLLLTLRSWKTLWLTPPLWSLLTPPLWSLLLTLPLWNPLQAPPLRQKPRRARTPLSRFPRPRLTTGS